jgi:hypothetical protein
VSEGHYPDDCGKCLEVWSVREGVLLDQIAAMRKALQAARPFIATEARLVNYGVGHPGSGEAPAVLEAINEALRGRSATAQPEDTRPRAGGHVP